MASKWYKPIYFWYEDLQVPLIRIRVELQAHPFEASCSLLWLFNLWDHAFVLWFARNSSFMWNNLSFSKEVTWLSTATRKSFIHWPGIPDVGFKLNEYLDPLPVTWMISLKGGAWKSFISESQGSLKSSILPRTAFLGVTIFRSNLYAVPKRIFNNAYCKISHVNSYDIYLFEKKEMQLGSIFRLRQLVYENYAHA